jgi:hypothetical protein
MRKLLQSALVLPLSCVLAAVGSGTQQADAAVVKINAPTSTAIGALESRDTIFAFQESTVDIGDPVLLDITNVTPGNQIGPSPTPGEVVPLSPGLISGKFTSYMLHFDPVPRRDGSDVKRNASGTIDFGAEFGLSDDQVILGLIVGDDTLDLSDNPLGLPGTIYPAGPDSEGKERRGLGFGFVASGFQEFIKIVDSQTLEVSFNTKESVDQIRVLIGDPDDAPVARTPEPSSILSILALGMVAASSRFRSRKEQKL